ncbi:MAG TPA: hypothetical protein VHV74_04100 [Pseudonocardiaceae bacterium]|nr:hypothetical protein [Pseudonocardiaceae bacterium]
MVTTVSPGSGRGSAGKSPSGLPSSNFHNTRNTGYANAVTALDCGVAALDASIGGVGGCPFAPAATGNIATDDLLYTLDRSEVTTGARLTDVIETAGWLAGKLGKPVPALLGRAGPFPAGK